MKFLLEPACRYLNPSNFTRTPLPRPQIIWPLHHGIKVIPIPASIRLVIFSSLTFTPSFRGPKYPGTIFFPYIIKVDWVGRARIIPTSDHLVRGVIRFPHSNPADIIRFPLEIGSASCTLSSCNLRRISLNIKLNVYSPWNCQVIFLEEFALHVMYSGHSIKALVLHQCESTPKSHNKIRKFLWKKVRRSEIARTKIGLCELSNTHRI